MKVSVLSDVCQGHGRCYVNSPELFRDDEFGHSVVTQEVLSTPEHLRAAESAKRICPEGAITIDWEGEGPGK
jgi:ferredoxin